MDMDMDMGTCKSREPFKTTRAETDRRAKMGFPKDPDTIQDRQDIEDSTSTRVDGDSIDTHSTLKQVQDRDGRPRRASHRNIVSMIPNCCRLQGLQILGVTDWTFARAATISSLGRMNWNGQLGYIKSSQSLHLPLMPCHLQNGVVDKGASPSMILAALSTTCQVANYISSLDLIQRPSLDYIQPSSVCYFGDTLSFSILSVPRRPPSQNIEHATNSYKFNPAETPGPLRLRSCRRTQSLRERIRQRRRVALGDCSSKAILVM